MNRTTVHDIDWVMKTIGRKLGEHGYFIQYGSNGARLCRQLGNGGVDEVSPALPKGQMFQWLHAFLKGVEAKELMKHPE